jgi:hypothetical protein
MRFGISKNFDGQFKPGSTSLIEMSISSFRYTCQVLPDIPGIDKSYEIAEKVSGVLEGLFL